MRIFHAMLIALILSVCPPGAARAGDGAGGEVRAWTGEIVVGATFPLSGALETYGQSAYYGANACARRINESGGINGKKLVLQWRDNRSDGGQAVRDIEELHERFGVAVVLGPLLSEAVMAVRPTAERLGIVLMSPLATMDAVTLGTPWVFRSCFNNTAQAGGMIKFQMGSYGAKSGGILYDSRSPFAVELADIFAEKFAAAGGTLVGKRSFVDASGAKDYETPMKALAEKNPDFIFAACYALEGTEILHSARDLKISTRFCGPDAWDNQLVFDASGTRLSGTSFASALFEQSYSYKSFHAFFNAMERAGMDNPDAQAACAWDAVALLAHALKSGETPEAVRAALLKVRRMPLATGNVTISPDGNAVKPVLIRVVERARGGLLPVYAARFDP